MKNFHIFLTRKVKPSQNNSIYSLSWNKKSNLIAIGCQNGQIKLISVVPSRDQPGSVQIEQLNVLGQHKKEIDAVACANDENHFVSVDSTEKFYFGKGRKGIGGST
jgi:WD repeat-containing protein 35